MSGELMSVSEFITKRNGSEASTAAQYETAFYLQEDIKLRKKRIQEDEALLKNMINCLAEVSDDVFSITELKPTRVPNLKWIKENMPDVYDNLLKVSDTDCGRIMSEIYTRKQLNEFLIEMSPKLFQEKAKILIGDFDAAMGGKKKAERFEGTAFKTEWNAGTKTEIIRKYPQELPALTEAEE